MSERQDMSGLRIEGWGPTEWGGFRPLTPQGVAAYDGLRKWLLHSGETGKQLADSLDAEAASMQAAMEPAYDGVLQNVRVITENGGLGRFDDKR
jgi:hypothetical protein